MRYMLLIVALTLTLGAAPSATTCAAPNTIPAGAVVTPDCTYIVAQIDPGVWRDNLNSIWAWVEAWGRAVKVAALADLHIGR